MKNQVIGTKATPILADKIIIIDSEDGDQLTEASFGDIGINVVERTTGSGVAGETDVYTMYSDVAKTKIKGTFDVTHGLNGDGAVIDNLTSTETESALSANQGRELKEYVETHTKGVSGLRLQSGFYLSTGELGGTWLAYGIAHSPTNTIPTSGAGFTLGSGRTYLLECDLYCTGIYDGTHVFAYWVVAGSSAEIGISTMGGVEYVSGSGRETMPATIKAIIKPTSTITVRVYLRTVSGSVSLASQSNLRSTSMRCIEL